MKSVVPVDLTSLMMPPCWSTKRRVWSPGGEVTNVGSVKAPTGSRSSTCGFAVAPPLPTSSASAANPATSATSPPRVPLIAERLRLPLGWPKRYPGSADRARYELLEARDQLLALAEEPPLLEEARAHALLDALDEDAILGPDLAVELEQLIRRPRIRIRHEEVVEKAGRALRPGGQQRADREIRRARVGVQLEVRPDEVELRLAFPARRRELRQNMVGAPFEPVLVRVDVVGGAEALVRDRAVVALEVVLAGDLPVRGELVVVARVEGEAVTGDER